MRLMTVDAGEFIRRFLLHVLPLGFVRLRQYGLLSNRNRTEKLAKCRVLLQQSQSADAPSPKMTDWKSWYQALTGIPFDICPVCRQGRMVCVEVFVSPLSIVKSRHGRSPPGGNRA